MPAESTISIFTPGGWVSGLTFLGSYQDLADALRDDDEITFEHRAMGNTSEMIFDCNAILGRHLLKEKTIGDSHPRQTVETKPHSVLPPHPERVPHEDEDSLPS